MIRDLFVDDRATHGSPRRRERENAIDSNQVALLPERVSLTTAEKTVRGWSQIPLSTNWILRNLAFNSTTPASTGRRFYHPAVMLKIYSHGYLKQVPSIEPPALFLDLFHVAQTRLSGLDAL